MKVILLNSVSGWIEEHRQLKSIYDPVRKKQVTAFPEEIVRQALIRYLMAEKGYPRTLMGVEVCIRVLGQDKRCDLVIFKNVGPMLIAECKAPTVHISQSVLDQAARYNLALQVPYLMVSNGLTTLCSHIDFTSGQTSFLDQIPEYRAL